MHKKLDGKHQIDDSNTEGDLKVRNLEMRSGDKGFFERAMKTQDSQTYIRKVQAGATGRYFYIPEDIVSKMKLEYKTSVVWSREGNSLTMSVLPETTAQVRSWKHSQAGRFVTITEDMLVAGGVKVGDYARWSKKGDKLFLRKTENAGMDARKITLGSGRGPAGVIIPKVIVEELKLDDKPWGLLTFDKNGLCFEFKKENPHIVSIYTGEGGHSHYFAVAIPLDMGWIKNGQEVILEVKEGKLYVRAKE